MSPRRHLQLSVHPKLRCCQHFCHDNNRATRYCKADNQESVDHLASYYGCNFYSCGSNWLHYDHKASQVKPLSTTKIFLSKSPILAYVTLCHF